MATREQKWYGVWCFGIGGGKSDWLRELPSKVDDGGDAILGYTSVRAAWSRAAQHFGYHSYSAAKRAGWCEVRQVVGARAAQRLPNSARWV